MKKLKLIRNVNALDGEEQFNSEPGRIEGILIVAEGTNNTGQTGDASNVGRFIITRDGDQTHNRTMDVFQNIGNIRSGTNIDISEAGGEFRQSAFIPFFQPGFPNALNIIGDNELNIRYQPGDDGTVFDSLDVKFYAQIADLGEAYQYKMIGNDLSIASQTTQLEQLNQMNTVALYIDDIDGVIDRLQFEQNAQITVSNLDFQALQAYTIYNNRIEDSSFTYAEILAATPGVPDSTLNSDNTLTVTTTGAGDIDVTVCAMIWND